MNEFTRFRVSSGRRHHRGFPFSRQIAMRGLIQRNATARRCSTRQRSGHGDSTPQSAANNPRASLRRGYRCWPMRLQVGLIVYGFPATLIDSWLNPPTCLLQAESARPRRSRLASQLRNGVRSAKRPYAVHDSITCEIATRINRVCRSALWIPQIQTSPAALASPSQTIPSFARASISASVGATPQFGDLSG